MSEPRALAVSVLAQLGAALALAALLFFLVTRLARPLKGMGIVVSPILPPLVAAGLALCLAPEAAPQIGLAAGVLGVLAADLLHLRQIPDLGARVVSLGGAGTFDAILACMVLAAFLAA